MCLELVEGDLPNLSIGKPLSQLKLKVIFLDVSRFLPRHNFDSFFPI